MQIKKRLQINVIFSVLTALVICLVLFLSMQRINNADNMAKIAGELIIVVLERITLRNDFMRNNSKRAKEQWFAKHEQLDGLLKLALGNFRDAEDRKNIDTMINNQESIGNIFSAIVANRGKSGFNPESAVVSREVEDRLLSQLNMRVYEEVILGRQLLESSRKERASAQRQAGGGIIGILAIVIAAAVISSVTMSRAIAARVRRLRDGAAVIGGGNLEHRIDIKGDDEFAELSEAFNAMTEKLLGSHHELEKEIEERKRAEEALRSAHGELEIRIQERTSELNKVNESLEQRVSKRTAELQATNTSLRDARRAALNMMEDADIARRRAEEASAELRNSEERYRSLFDTLLEGFCIIEVLFDADDRPIDYRFLEINPMFEAQTGLHNAQGKLMRELAPENEAHWFEMYGRVALTGESARFVNEAKALNRWFDVSAYRVGGRDSRRVAILFNDITEAKQAEEALQKAHSELEQRVAERTEELALSIKLLQDEIGERERAEDSLQRLNRLYAVLSETNQAIVRATDRESLFRDFCRIAVEHGGFLLSWVGLVDEEPGRVKIIAASGATAYLDDVRITANEEPTGEGPTGISIRKGTYYICNDFQNDLCTRPWQEKGRAHGIRASASVALKEQERVIGALTLYAGEKDFFDQQHVELLRQMGADISFALNSLNQASRRREAELALQKETLERIQALEALRVKEQLLVQQSRMAALGEMIGNIAHQWRQPLNVLGLTLQELSFNYEPDTFTREYLDDSVAKSLQIISHMSQTIDGFRNFFRPDKERVPFNVNTIIVRTVSLVEASLRDQQIGVDIVVRDDLVIDGFPNEYSQVVLNILLNARDAFIDRENDEPRMIRITLSREEGKSVVTIADNAGGIPEEIIEKIFDPYFTTKGPDKGTGVGLFMSKTIIEKSMNGSLRAHNTEEGATFRIEV